MLANSVLNFKSTKNRRFLGQRNFATKMSSQQPFNTVQPIGEVQHIHFLSEDIGALYKSDEYSDVTLVVDNQRFHVHRVILAARSEYFRAMLYGGMKESQLCDIELKDTPLAAFEHLLKYIYTGHMTLGNQRDGLTLEVLGLAHKYGFEDLESSISDYLRAVLSVKNVSFIYDMASLYSLDDLVASCCAFMDRHATEVVQHESFTNLSSESIKVIIGRDSFCAPEVDIFKAVHKWVEVNEPSEEDRVRILDKVRLNLMSTQDLLRVVRPTSLVHPDVLLDAIQSQTECRDMELKYRGYLIPDENIATAKYGACVMIGEVKHALLDGDSFNYDMEKGFSRHPIDDNGTNKGIVVRLGTQCIINHLRMLLWDKDSRAYSYTIDISVDQKDWVRVVDHSKYLCRSWQHLYFEPRVVRYIRITGTHNTVNKVFHVVALEAFYVRRDFVLDSRGILVPGENVATIAKSACVVEGVCRSRHALLNGDINNYDWDSGYTCHQLGSGALLVQLGQPYSIGSMKLLLWDCDDRCYSYFIEVSTNNRDWVVVCDRSKQPCRSWQHITFAQQPIVFIRIVGTHNTANEVFHCVHFECPAVTDAPSEVVCAKAPVDPDVDDTDERSQPSYDDQSSQDDVEPVDRFEAGPSGAQGALGCPLYVPPADESGVQAGSVRSLPGTSTQGTASASSRTRTLSADGFSVAEDGADNLNNTGRNALQNTGAISRHERHKRDDGDNEN